MTNARRFQLDELTLRPGTYFNPQTEIMIVVDDTPEVDHELFSTNEFDSDEWVLIAEDVPVDESRRDELVERFQRTHQEAGAHRAREDSDFDELEDEDEDEDEDDEGLGEDDEDDLEPLDLEHDAE